MVAVGEARLFVLDSYTGHSNINIKEIVEYNRLELRARYKFECYQYVNVLITVELIFEI